MGDRWASRWGLLPSESPSWGEGVWGGGEELDLQTTCFLSKEGHSHKRIYFSLAFRKQTTYTHTCTKRARKLKQGHPSVQALQAPPYSIDLPTL